MEASIDNLPPPVLAAASPAETVTVAVRLLHKQRGLFFIVVSFIGSGLLDLALIWGLGKATYVPVLISVVFWLPPFALIFFGRNTYIKPALLSFTPQGFSLEASDKQYRVAWADLMAYQVEFALGQLVGDGYRLKLWDAQGSTIVLNLLEKQPIEPTVGLRADSALAYLCRYIGQHNREAKEEQIGLRPTLLASKTGALLLGGLSTLLLIDLGIRWLYPAAKGVTVSLLAGAVALWLGLLGERKQNERYARYLKAAEAEGRNS